MELFTQKLLVPNLPAAILQRTALLARLDAAADAGRMVLVIGPAGWGKTVALATWVRLRQERAPVSWYALDPSDGDPLQFVRYLIAALQPHCPELAAIADRVNEHNDPAALPALLERTALILAACPRPLHLVLDDMHAIVEQCPKRTRPIFDLLDQLARYAPALHLTLASRVNLPATARRRLQGAIEALDTSTLAFSAEDITTLAAARYGLALTSRHAHALAGWSEGWPIAIGLALEEVYRQYGASPALPASFLFTTMPELLYAFLAEEIFATLPASLQQFLLDTVVLDRLTPEGCAALCQNDQAALLLAEAQQRGLVAHVHGPAFSYHELVRSFLQRRLWANPGYARQMTRRAAELHLQWGEYQAAFALWLSLGDYAAAEALVLQVGPQLNRRGQHATVLAWLDDLHAQTRLSSPLLMLQAQIALSSADWTRVYSAIQQARAADDPAARAQAQLLEIEVACVQRQVERVRLLADAITVATLPSRLRSDGYVALGRAAMAQRRYADALALFRQAMEARAEPTGSAADPAWLAYLYELMGSALSAIGNDAEAQYHLRCADATWQTAGEQRQRVLTLHKLGVALMRAGSFAEAAALLEEGMTLAECYDHRVGQVLIASSRADLDLLEGRFSAALVGYAAAIEYARRAALPAAEVYASAGALRAAVYSGDLHERRRWLPIVEGIAPAAAAGYADLLVLVRALAAASLEEAAPLLAEVTITALPEPHDVALAYMLRAQIAYSHGGWSAAIAHWEALEQHVAGSRLDRLLGLQAVATGGLLAAASEYGLARRLLRTVDPDLSYWEFRAMGGFEVFCNGQERGSSVRPLDQLVLLRLLEARATGLSVQRLWEDVWGDRPFSADAVRQSLSRIRRSTDLPIQMHLGHCQIQAPWSAITYDVDRFDAPLSQPHDRSVLQQRLALYRGKLLNHLNYPSLWLESRRTALHRRFLYLREALALKIEPGDPHEALQIYSAVLAEDGCREAAAAGVMRCALQLGDRLLAIATYQQVCTDLFEQLGVDPSPELSLLYQKLA